jgi:hypothetical protein
VLINRTAVNVTDNTLTLNYEDIADNNTVEVYFVSDRVAEREEAQGVTVVYPYVPKATVVSTDAPADEVNSNVLKVIVIVIIAAVALAAAAVLFIQISNDRKDSDVDSDDGKGGRNSSNR